MLLNYALVRTFWDVFVNWNQLEFYYILWDFGDNLDI